ncbi:hypothetical protein HK096_009338, partial [Nowakowskiella sp. JEL0078]
MARHGIFTFHDKPKDGENDMFRYLKDKADKQLFEKIKKYRNPNIQENEKDCGYWCYKALLDAFLECQLPNSSSRSKINICIGNFYANILNWRASIYIGKKRLINDRYQYLSPTETAIFHQNVEIMDHIKENLWEFGPTHCFMIPL